jgi:hypothetical protein
VLTKLTFGLLASGPIYIERWIRQAIPSISCYLRDVMQLLPSASFKKHYGHQIILVHE